MGTRSDIIVECGDGKVRRVYCHWDGYLSHNGRILNEHYKDQETVEKLVALGDLSSLKPIIGRKHPFDAPNQIREQAAYNTYQSKYGDMCTYYGRDRGEKNTDASVHDSLTAAWPPEDSGTEFTYVWRKNKAKWFVAINRKAGPKSLRDLGHAVAADAKKQEAA